MRGVRALLVLLLAAGCSVVVTNANPVAVSSAVNVSGAVAAAAPEREVSLQDCTKPVDLTAGNLRCR